jgi:hypothetical protein
MKHLIKKLLREGLLDEVTDDVLDMINSQYSNAAIMMAPRIQQDGSDINYNPSVGGPQEITFKPNGLWYGIGSSWIDWVRREMPEWEKEDAYLLELDKSNMIVISNYEELLNFHKEFKSENGYIDWSVVASKYDGIEIAPHIREARWKINWYSTWDVASGCIWTSNVIKSSKLLKV